MVIVSSSSSSSVVIVNDHRDDDYQEDDDDIVYEVSDKEEDGHHHPPIKTIGPVVMQSTPVLAAMALALTVQGWRELGHGPDINVKATDDLPVTIERTVSLFLIRIVALVSQRSVARNNNHHHHHHHHKNKYSDLSTSTICRKALLDKAPWPKPITTKLIGQLRRYVERILRQYKAVHYHGFEHAYHVVLSCNKLLDMMLLEDAPVRRKRKTYGIKSDPLLQLALLFSALVHDVEHTGVSNRQLVLESDELAILYNDQSVAEQRSLAVAFSELKKDEYKALKEVLFPTIEDYRRFRKMVINLVLSTDIASPERTQLVKSKWKEAFGDTKEALERKKQKEMSRRSVFRNISPLRGASAALSLPSDWKGGGGGTGRGLGNNENNHPNSSVNHYHNNSSSIQSSSMPRNIFSGGGGGSGLSARSRMRRQESANGESRGSSGGHASTGVSSNSVVTQFSELTMDPSLRYLSSQIYRGAHTATTVPTTDDGMPNINDEDESDEASDGEDTTSATPETHDGLDPIVPGSDPYDGIIRTGTTLSASANADHETVKAVKSRSTSLTPPRSAPMPMNMETLQKELSLRWPVPEASGIDTSPQGTLRRGTTDGGALPRQQGYYRKSSSITGAIAWDSATAPVNNVSSDHKRNERLPEAPRARRFSAPDIKVKMRGHSVRLGIRRSMDLTGEAIENYSQSSRSSSTQGTPVSTPSLMNGSSSEFDYDPDEADELKATVVMEHIMRAADIAPNMQSWEHMKKWSTRLFFELMSSFSDGRGEDPQPKWFENQISFLESYILPLARRLDDTGVFGPKLGLMFATIVEENADKWVIDGAAVTSQIIYHWKAGDVTRDHRSFSKLEGTL